MYRNLYRKSSFRSCPHTVLVKCPVRFYSIFDEIGQNVDGNMYFYHKSHCSTIQNRTERQRFQFTCARERICAENLRRTFFRSEGLNLVPRARARFRPAVATRPRAPHSGKMSAHAPGICDSIVNRLRMLHFNRQIHTCYQNIFFVE